MDTRAEDEGELISVKPDPGKVVGFFARAVSLAAVSRGRIWSDLYFQGSKGLQNLGLVYL